MVNQVPRQSQYRECHPEEASSSKVKGIDKSAIVIAM